MSQEKASKKRKNSNSSRKPARNSDPRPQRRRLAVEQLEDRLVPSGDPFLYRAADATPLTLLRIVDQIQIVNSNSPTIVLDSRALADIQGGIRIEGNGHNVKLTVDASLPQVPEGVLFVGGSGTNTLSGPARDITWRVTGAGAGTLGNPGFLSFTGVENLIGAGNEDTFLFSPAGSLSGTVEGGAGGPDAITGPDANTDWVINGAGSGTFGGQAFTGIESLVGGTKDDTFKLDPGGSLGGAIVGGGGNNTLVGDNATNIWTVGAGANNGNLNGLIDFTQIANLIGGTGDDTFVFEDGAFVTGIIDGGGEDDDGDDGAIAPEEVATDTIDYSAYTTPVTVDVGAGTTTGSAGYVNIDAFIGGLADDEVRGPAAASVVWTVSGADEVSVAGVGFAAFENLSGANNNADVFVIEGAGNWSGTIRGGTGGTDGVVFIDPDDEEKSQAFNPPMADSTGLADAFGKSIDYTGLDFVRFYNPDDPLNPVITGTIFNDSIRVYADPETAGGLKIDFSGQSIALTPFEVTNLKSLRIDAIEGADTITVEPLPENFTASLLLYGNRLQRADLIYPKMPEDDPYPDTVIFSGDITLGYLEVFADHVVVNNDVRIDTGEDDIFIRSRLIGVATVENVLPVFATVRSVSVDIGANAVLKGGSIYFVVQAEDKSFAEVIGAGQVLTNFVIDPLADFVTQRMALPVKVLVKQSSASITLREGAQLLSGGTVGMYATAAADASGSASSSLVSVGYGRATATAEIDIRPGVVIDAAAAVVVTATANANASISSSAGRQGLDFFNTSAPPVAIAVGVADVTATSIVTVAAGASITAGKTANVTAAGEINAEATGEAGLDENGVAGLGIGIQISNANIHTTPTFTPRSTAASRHAWSQARS